MRNFTFGEIVTIVIVILIVFGPNRLPEMARKAGELAAKARIAIRSLREEFGDEYREVVEPVIEARDQIRATRKELTDELTTLRDQVQADLDETRLAVERVVKEDGEEGTDAEERAGTDVPDAEGSDITRLPVPDEAAPGEPEVDPATEDMA